MNLTSTFMPIVPLYASILALLFVLLSARTAGLRRSLRIAIGDEGNKEMLRAMRVHSNFAEYVPYCLLLMYFVEASAASPVLVHFLGTSLVVGRVSHAFGVSQARENFAFRVFGITLTFTVLVASAGYLLWSRLFNVVA